MYALQKAETYNIGSAAWSLTENCSWYVRAKLQSGTESGWEFYIWDCVGAAVTDVRKARAAQRLEAVKSLTHTHTHIYGYNNCAEKKGRLRWVVFSGVVETRRETLM